VKHLRLDKSRKTTQKRKLKFKISRKRVPNGIVSRETLNPLPDSAKMAIAVLFAVNKKETLEK